MSIFGDNTCLCFNFTLRWLQIPQPKGGLSYERNKDALLLAQDFKSQSLFTLTAFVVQDETLIYSAAIISLMIAQ